MSDAEFLADLEQLTADFRRSGLRELQARCGELEIYLSLDADAPGLNAAPGRAAPAGAPPVPAPVAAAPTPAAPAPAAAGAAAAARQFPADAHVVRAPYLGTFYRSPKPGSPTFVEVGSVVSPDSEVCLVEVMKLFTTVRAEAAGKVSEILAADGDLVTDGQPLFVILPA